MTLVESITGGLNHVLEVIYPSLCLVCGRPPDKPGELVCRACLGRIDGAVYPFCAVCGSHMERGVQCPVCGPEEALPVIGAGNHVEPLKELVHHFKYHGFRRLAELFAGILTAEYENLIRETAVELLVPVPLHSYRHKARGFNQSRVLADILGRSLGLPVAGENLERVKRTRDQTRLNDIQREHNVRDAFAVTGHELDGRRVLLVDDVITTGATLREARRTLETGGARPVMAAVVAQAMIKI